jgi:hypothetical protein
MTPLSLFFEMTSSENTERIADGEVFVNSCFCGADGRNRTADLLITNQKKAFRCLPTDFAKHLQSKHFQVWSHHHFLPFSTDFAVWSLHRVYTILGGKRRKSYELPGPIIRSTCRHLHRYPVSFLRRAVYTLEENATPCPSLPNA